VREYAPGDRIRFTLIIRHKVSIPDEQRRLWATFSHVGSHQTDLSRVVVVPGRVIDQSMTEEGHKNSHILFESEPIPVNSAPAGGVQAVERGRQDLRGDADERNRRAAQGSIPADRRRAYGHADRR
jgi:hypothetical protein